MKKIVIGLALALVLLLGCEGPASNDEDQVKIGIVQFSEHVALDKTREGFVDGLEAKGYELDLDVVNLQADISLLPVTINRFEAREADIIYAIATTAAQGAKHSSRATPVIFNAVTDPEGAKLVESNQEPGGRVTGVSDYFSVERQLDAFLEDFPEVKNLGMVYSTGEINSEIQMKELDEACQARGIELHPVGVATTNDVPLAMASLVGKIDAYVQIQDNLAASAAEIISKYLLEGGIPSFSGESGSVEGGLLLSDGIDYYQLGLMAADQAELILQGQDPGQIPVGFSEESNRVVNIKTYQDLGLEDEDILEGAEIVE